MKPLKRIRVLREMSQGELAEASGVSRQVISNIERGASKGYASTYRALAKALDVDMEDLMEGAGQGKVPGPLRRLSAEQRRVILRFVAEKHLPPAVGGDMKWLGEVKRAVAQAGMSDAGFRAWAESVEPNDVRDELLPEEAGELTASQQLEQIK